jgi:hypothetical protein
MRLLVALLLVVHGIAHFAGVRAAFWPGPIPPRRLIYLPRSLEGLVWLLLGVGFVAVGALVFSGHDSWRSLLLWSSGGSLVMCVLAWPSAKIGLVVDALLVVLTLLLAPTSTSSYIMAAAQLGTQRNVTGSQICEAQSRPSRHSTQRPLS